MKYDYLIIGAGVIGCATAYHLKRAQPDAEILLVDRNNRVGAGNTAKSAALYRNIFSSTVNRILASSSISFYLKLADNIQLDPIGYFWLFSEAQWKRSLPARQELDITKDDFEVLDKEDIKKIVRLNSLSKD